MKKILFVLIVALMFVGCAKKEIVTEDVNAVIKPEITPTVISLEKNTVEGSIINIMTVFKMYDINVKSIQITSYSDYEVSVWFEYKDMDYNISTNDAENIDEFVEDIQDLMTEIEDIVND